MSDLIEKLNVLLRSSVNNFLSSQPDNATPRVGSIAANRLGKDIDAEIANLRKQIETALAQEDAMQARLDKSQQQIEDYDRQADAAVSRNDDATARAVLQQMERQKQQAALLKADLEQHRQSTSEFIEHVNTLDAIRSDALRQKQEAQAQSTSSTTDTMVSDAGAQTDPQSDRAPILSDLLRNVRERVNEVVTPRTAPSTTSTPSEPTEPAINSDKSSIKIAIGGTKPAASAPNTNPATKADAAPPTEDDDLAKRRARLSKPD